MSHPLPRLPLAGTLTGQLRAATASIPQGASAPATTAFPHSVDTGPIAFPQEALAGTSAVFPTPTGHFPTGNFNGIA